MFTWIISTRSSSTGLDAATWCLRLKLTFFSCRKIAPVFQTILQQQRVCDFWGGSSDLICLGDRIECWREVGGAIIRGRKSRSCLMNRSRFTGDGHRGLLGIRCQGCCRNVWGGEGGSYFLEGGSRKGGSDEPPWLQACNILLYRFSPLIPSIADVHHLLM